MPNTAELMLLDYASEMLVLIRDAQKVAQHRDTFEDGRRMGLYEALCLLIDQAKGFGISLDAIGLGNVDPDIFLK